MSGETAATYDMSAEITAMNPLGLGLWDRVCEKAGGVSFRSGGCDMTNGCSHGVERICSPGPLLDEIIESVTSSHLTEIMQGFMLAYEDVINNIFSNGSDKMPPPSLLGKPLEMFKQINVSLMAKGPDVLPDVSDPNYMKTVSVCLAALGTEYLVQANIQQNQKERYIMMSTVVATTLASFEHDVATSLTLDATRGELKRAPASFFDGKNGNECNCLKDYDGEEIDSEWFASLCQDFLKKDDSVDADEEVCGHCKQKKERLLRCAGCKSIKYCGSECQRADWQNHKSVCKEKKASAGK